MKLIVCGNFIYLVVPIAGEIVFSGISFLLRCYYVHEPCNVWGIWL